MANQMGNYLPNLAKTNKPLRDLLSKQSAWIWDDLQQKVFEEIKKQLTSAPAWRSMTHIWRQQTDPRTELELH